MNKIIAVLCFVTLLAGCLAVGTGVAEEKEINVTFPENYGAKDLAGKAAVFTVTVHEVKFEKLPEYTDEYVKSLNVKDVNTLDELKAYKKKELEDAKLELGTLRQLKLPFCNKREIMQAIVDRDYRKLRLISEFFLLDYVSREFRKKRMKTHLRL